MALFDVIIPTYNQADYTIRCLKSIQRHTRDYRVIWIDNGSDPDEVTKVKDVIKNMPNFHILNTENLGFVKGVNQGIATSTAPFVVILNNDTEVTRNWADKLASVMSRDKSVGIVGCLTNAHGSWQGIPNLAKAFGIAVKPFDDKIDTYADYIDRFFTQQYRIVPGMVAFFCAMLKRTTIQKVGYLSEEFGIGLGDDDDFCHRTRNAGLRVACALDVFVFHNHRTTFKSIYTDEELKKIQDTNINLYKRKHNV